MLASIMARSWESISYRYNRRTVKDRREIYLKIISQDFKTGDVLIVVHMWLSRWCHLGTQAF